MVTEQDLNVRGLDIIEQLVIDHNKRDRMGFSTCLWWIGS